MHRHVCLASSFSSSFFVVCPAVCDIGRGSDNCNCNNNNNNVYCCKNKCSSSAANFSAVRQAKAKATLV